jgi:hypothetical protein
VGRFLLYRNLVTWEVCGQFGTDCISQIQERGVATQIKHKVFQLSREKYPEAKVFGLTTGLAVMKINSDLGYKPVIYSELTQDEEFWNGCKNCVNYEILMKKERKNCFVQPCFCSGK